VTFHQSTEAYETWLGSQLEIVPEDLKEKHALMKEAIFPFLRATYYRWAQLWPQVCPDLNTAPAVLAIGDLHIENFGTWRDAEGRLVWGVNDFDEADFMPYTADLVRLAVSAHVSIDSGRLNVGYGEACQSLLGGYQECLEAGGQPYVLSEKHQWLSELVELRNPVTFWDKLNALTDFKGHVPSTAKKALEQLLPPGFTAYRVAHRKAGLGSLGRQRFVALGEYRGGHICREAKALAPSAWWWAQTTAAKKGSAKSTEPIHCQQALDSSVRSYDPLVRVADAWVVRRLAPDCAKIELSSVPREKDKTRLLRAMGWETANIHLGSKNAPAILADLKKKDVHWLHEGADRMKAATLADWQEWK